MKISYSWLKQYINLDESPEAVAALLTKSGLEVESVEPVETIKGGLQGLVIGHVLTREKHPNADKLSKTTVDVGNGVVLPIVCGAPNVDAGQKVIVATVGAVMYPTEGESFKISKSKIRGEVSEGMICAEDEIGLGKSHEGIMVLDTDLPVGTPAAKYFNLETDFVFEIGLTPNRADAASHLGVARDLRALLNRPVLLPALAEFKVDNTSKPVKVRVEAQDAAPRYAGLTISGLTVKPSPDWLQKKLIAIGLSPINNVVDATNYILHDLGQPLHAFDLSEVKGNEVVVRTFPEGTLFKTLDGIERKLSATDLVIANAEEPMCLAGVFGGEKSGVKDSTTAIFLESAYFSADSVRRTGQRHGLKTDASFRFERGTDPNMPVYALKRAALLIKEVAGGEVSSEITDIYPTPIADFKVDVTYRGINRLIGNDIPKERVKEILEHLEIKIANSSEEGLSLLVPPYRVDVQREADIAEEVLRIYGFENIVLPAGISADYLAEFPEKDKEKLQVTIATLLADNGFYEIITNSLTKPVYAEKLASVDAAANVDILNKLSEDLGVMRQSLLFSGLEVLLYNINRRQKDLKVFEFGKTYHKREGKYQEYNRLGLYLTGLKQYESWLNPSDQVDFHDLSTALIKVLTKANVQGFTTEKIKDDMFAEGLAFVKNNKVIARAGRLNKEIVKLADIKQSVYYADVDWDLVVKQFNQKYTFEEISKFPEVRRDLSLVLDKKVTFAEIKESALKTEKKLIRQVNVFDVYDGEKIEQGKKSYSVSFMLQDNEKTLTDEQIDTVMNRLIGSYEKDLGAIIRK